MDKRKKKENITAIYLILECKKKKSQWKKTIDLSKIIHIKRKNLEKLYSK